MPRVVQEKVVPGLVLSLSGFDRTDYADLFVASLEQPLPATAEHLARAAIEGASAAGRVMAWRIACRLRLAPPGPGVIGGWRIDGRGPGWIRVATRSPVMSAAMVFTLEESRASFATFIRYDRPVAALTWGATVSRGHRAVAPGFLGAAVGRLQQEQRTHERS